MFSPNQKVKCINAEGQKPWLRVDRIYTVAHHFEEGELADKNGNEGGGVMLLDHRHPRTNQLKRPPVFYKASRFEAVEPDCGVDEDGDQDE